MSISAVYPRFALLEDSKNDLLDLWLGTPAVVTALEAYGIPPHFFKKYFASKVIDYAFGVANGSNRPGDCPVIGVMLVFFEKKNMSLRDVFTICVNLKNMLIETALEKGVLEREMLREICALVDTNFLGVIRAYLDLHYHDDAPNSSCSFTERPALFCTTMAPSFETEPVTSAMAYAEELELDEEILQELAEIEKETLMSFELTGHYVEETHQDVIRLFTQYAKMIDQLVEFQQISYALWVLSDVLQQTDIAAFEGETEYISMYNKAIIHDLSTWRTSVFYNQTADDIHYLDKTLLSSITQLQIMLSPSGGSGEEEIEFF